jgi:hypothetical protein
MDPRGVPRPSPYSLQPITSPEAGGYAQTIQGGVPRTNYASASSQQFAAISQQSALGDPTGSGVELQNTKKIADPFVQVEIRRDRDPPPYSEHEKHPPEARLRTGHEVVELHEGGVRFDDHPQALQTMLNMVSMLNFMKVQISASQNLSIHVIATQFGAITTDSKGRFNIILFTFCMQVELGDHNTLRSKEQWRAAAAEFIGTMLFVYLGCGSVIASGTFNYTHIHQSMLSCVYLRQM